MTEREAFIESIAADPGDETARLAFADWLQERSEDARAEFIRVACVADRQPRPAFRYASPLTPEQERAEWSLTYHWHEWFGPVLAAVGMPAPGPCRALRGLTEYGPYIFPSGLPGPPLIPLVFRSNYDKWQNGLDCPKTQFLHELRLDRGFVTGLTVAPAFATGSCSLAAALRREPIDRLRILLDTDPGPWGRLSDQLLQRVRSLDVELVEHPGPLTDFTAAVEALLNDPHLDGVRDLRFTAGESDYVAYPLPTEVADGIVGSAVLSRCVSLSVVVDEGGLRSFDETNPAGLRRLALEFQTNTPVALNLPQYRDRLEALDLSGQFLDLATFGRGRPWARLRRLAFDGLGEWFVNRAVLTNPDQFPALEELQVPVAHEFDADALAVAIRAGCFPRLRRLELAGRAGPGSVATVAEAVAGSPIREFDARPMWDSITRAELTRVQELLGDRARTNEPRETDDAIPF